MKSKVLFIAIVSLAMAGCKFHFINDPVDESVLPTGEATDNACSINIPKTATEIYGMTYEEADAYLCAAGWIKDFARDPSGNYYVCADTTDIPGRAGMLTERGPRTEMSITVIDGAVTNATVWSTILFSEQPYQQLAKWDAWLYNHAENKEKWEASMTIEPEKDNTEHYRYMGEVNGEHQSFLVNLQSLDVSQIWNMQESYLGTPFLVHINVTTQFADGYCNIKFQATRYRNKF